MIDNDKICSHYPIALNQEAEIHYINIYTLITHDKHICLLTFVYSKAHYIIVFEFPEKKIPPIITFS